MFEVNFAAVLVATLVTFVVGFLWYSDLMFGKPWRKYMGVNTKEMKKESMLVPILLGFAGLFISMWALAYVMNVMVVTEYMSAIKVALFVWLGFVATTHFSKWVWSDKSFNLFLIDALHHLAAFVVGALIFQAWF